MKVLTRLFSIELSLGSMSVILAPSVLTVQD
jgi:hypothetical protein